MCLSQEGLVEIVAPVLLSSDSPLVFDVDRYFLLATPISGVGCPAQGWLVCVKDLLVGAP